MERLIISILLLIILFTVSVGDFKKFNNKKEKLHLELIKDNDTTIIILLDTNLKTSSIIDNKYIYQKVNNNIYKFKLLKKLNNYDCTKRNDTVNYQRDN